MADEHSLRKLMPSFIISSGTQVVLKVAKVLPDGEEYKPQGSVGVVVESPSSNREPYVVRFADGQTVRAYFHELAMLPRAQKVMVWEPRASYARCRLAFRYLEGLGSVQVASVVEAGPERTVVCGRRG